MTEKARSTARERLYAALRRVADQAQVARALGIEDPATQPEEFWQGQKRAARNRFLQLCLQELKIDQALRMEDLDDETCEPVAAKAEEFLAVPGFDYALVRRWFHARGQFQYNKALELARERNFLKDSVLRVLAVLAAGGAKYLAFGPGIDEVRLVAENEAHEFPILSATELTKEHRAALAQNFAYLKDRIGAKEIKVLQAARMERAA